MIQNRFVVCWLLLVFVAILMRAASAQSSAMFNAPGIQPHREYVSGLPFEHIDPSTGSLVLTFADLVLPGDAGRDLVFQRTYNSKGPIAPGEGQWTFGIGGVPLLVTDSWPVAPEWTPLLHMADGGTSSAASVVYPVTHPDHRCILMTDQFWKYYRSSRILWLPDGRVVNFDSMLRLQSVQDSFGNIVLSVSYNGQTVTVTQHLAGGSTRSVVLTFPATCAAWTRACLPTTMGYEDRTWTYEPGPSGLAEVRPPIGPSWRYEYGTIDSMRTMRTTTPHGGSILYSIETLSFPWPDNETVFTDVLRFRETLVSPAVRLRRTEKLHEERSRQGRTKQASKPNA